MERDSHLSLLPNQTDNPCRLFVGEYAVINHDTTSTLLVTAIVPGHAPAVSGYAPGVRC